jgi:hypothetical protein
MDISNMLYEAKTFSEFCGILKLTLPFIAKYCDEFLVECLIEDVRVNEIRLTDES